MNNYEIDLVLRAKSGDKEAFTKLISIYKKEMYCISKFNLKADVDVDDAIQETLYKAYVGIKWLREPKYEMIDSLDIEGKELLSLKYSNHYDNKAIAKILNIKEGTLRMRLLRIRNKLKMKYKGDKENE